MLKWSIVENTNETQDYTFHLPATRNLETQWYEQNKSGFWIKKINLSNSLIVQV